jgi:hypothetical protein
VKKIKTLKESYSLSNLGVCASRKGPSETWGPGMPDPHTIVQAVAYPGILFGRGGSANSVEDRGQREWGSGGGSPPSQGFWRQL